MDEVFLWVLISLNSGMLLLLCSRVYRVWKTNSISRQIEDNADIAIKSLSAKIDKEIETKTRMIEKIMHLTRENEQLKKELNDPNRLHYGSR